MSVPVLSTLTALHSALLVNIGAYNKAHAEGDEAAMEHLRDCMKAPLPLLDQIGFFDLFTPEEWINDTENEGRRLVGQLFLEYQEAQGDKESRPS